VDYVLSFSVRPFFPGFSALRRPHLLLEDFFEGSIFPLPPFSFLPPKKDSAEIPFVHTFPGYPPLFFRAFLSLLE